MILCVGIAGALLLRSPRVRAQTPGAVNKYSLVEVPADLPAGWDLWPEYKTVGDNAPSSLTFHRWRGRTSDPSQPPSPQNKILEAASVKILVGRTPQEAWRIAPGNGGAFVQVRPVVGSYSGKLIGDRMLRGGLRSSTGATLWFVRGYVGYAISINGPPDAMDYAAAVENLATSLIARADAAFALAASTDGTVQVGGRTVACKQPNALAVVRVSDYAEAAGASCQLDILGGSETISRNGHTLKMNVGRTEAWFDGSPITLPFPALRDGKDQVYCPLDTLRRLGP